MRVTKPGPRSRRHVGLLLVAASLAWPTGEAHAEEPPPDTGRSAEPSRDALHRAPPVGAGDRKAACVQSFDEAQRLRNQGKLLAARASLIECGQQACPAVVQSQCVQWLRELTGSLPSIVVLARDAAGKDIVDVRVLVDGEAQAQGLDGRPILLDPGLHALRFERAGAPPVEQPLVAVEGQKNREVLVRFAAPEPPPARAEPPPAPALVEDDASSTPPPAAPASRGLSPVFYAGLAAGAAGVLAGTITGVVALGQGAALKDECQGDVCTPDKQGAIDSGTTIAHVSTVSFAVGAAGLGTALVAYLTRGPRAAGPSVTARISTGGLEAAIAGRF